MRLRSLAVVGLVVLGFTLVTASPAYAEWQYFQTAEHQDPPLADSTITTRQGAHLGDTCVWYPPSWDPAPTKNVVEARQIAANYETCEEQVEVGTPSGPPAATGGSPIPFGCSTVEVDPACDASAGQSDAPGQTPAGWTTSPAYITVWWHDFAHIELNKVRAAIAWTWQSGHCILGSTASYQNWQPFWWFLYSASTWRTTSCDNHRAWVDAHFKTYFCTPPAHVFYNDQRVRGGRNGDWGAAITSTWMDGACFPGTHWHYYARREWWF